MRRLILCTLFLLLSIISFFGPKAYAEHQTRIIGGIPAPIGNYPFQVGLVFTPSENSYFCGGVLVKRTIIGASRGRPAIDRTAVLTAAHCLDSVTSSNQILALIGIENLDLAQRKHKFQISGYRVHPSYDKRTKQNDLALLYLSPNPRIPGQKALLDSLSSKFVVLPSKEPAAGLNAWVAGWGTTDVDNPDVTPILRAAAIKIINRETCNTSYEGAVTREMICAGLTDGGRDSCQGDSGGPLVIADQRQMKRVLVGTVSWGRSCALAGFPGVYTNIFQFKKWISNNW